jgi:SAM-dependent methyltransferase
MEYSDGVVPNFRERFACSECGLNNRQRFLLGLLKERIDAGNHDVYLLEQTTMFFSKAAALAGARCTGSEYLGGDKVCGAEYAGIRHEDCTCYSFQDMTFDVVVSQDVFEHVPDIDRSLAETFRILRDGGVLLMTVPFDVNSGKTVQRAMLAEGEVQLLCDPVYHANPVSEKGSLVYYDFGWDLLDRMRRAGFKKAEVINYFDTKRMHIGSDLLVFRGER